MPVAARADTEYFSSTSRGSSRIVASDGGSDDEHSSPALRHSEVAAIENPPSHAVPDPGQFIKHDSEVPTAVRAEESAYVLCEYKSRLNSRDHSYKLEEESGPLTRESCSIPGGANVLTREAADEEINGSIGSRSPHVSDVGEALDSGPMVGKD